MIGLPSLILVLLYSSMAAGCRDGQPPSTAATSPTIPDSTFIPYDFGHPDASFTLPTQLREISGLAVLDSMHLAAVQDEVGTLYVLDRETAQIVTERRFRGGGDYEAIEVVDGTAWVLRSDGTLFSLAQTPGGELEPTGHDMQLHGNCDAEGLAFHPRSNRLLISCKENPGRGIGSTRAVYAFDLGTQRRVEAPVYLIDHQQLDVPGTQFKPSALAVHPQSGHVYVLSSVRKMLIVIDPAGDGQILEYRVLPPALFPQPEGLAFFPDGTLYISNEGVNGPATLLRFNERTATP